MEKQDVERSRGGLLVASASHILTNKITKGQFAGDRSRNGTEDSREAEGLTWFCTEYIHNGSCS